MKTKITNYLKQIEQDKEIKILLACETGSRAWGFPSPDSDYDVRLIYVHKRDWYLGITESKDSLQEMYENNDLDFSGWELRKCLRLLTKSNAALLERIQSPIIYQADAGFMNEIMQIATPCYSPRTTLHHYLGLAKRSFADIVDLENYKLKKFFYALRASVACLWIQQKEQMPPIEFQKMIYVLDIDKSIINRIEELIELKATISESYLHEGEAKILEFINANIIQAKQRAGGLAVAKCDINKLNTFFIKSIPD